MYDIPDCPFCFSPVSEFSEPDGVFEMGCYLSDCYVQPRVKGKWADRDKLITYWSTRKPIPNKEDKKDGRR